MNSEKSNNKKRKIRVGKSTLLFIQPFKEGE
jgi:hypothetical protein